MASQMHVYVSNSSSSFPTSNVQLLSFTEIAGTVRLKTDLNAVGRYVMATTYDYGHDFNMCEVRVLSDPVESKALGRGAFRENPHGRSFDLTDGLFSNSWTTSKLYSTTSDMEYVDLGSVKRVNRAVLNLYVDFRCLFQFCLIILILI